MHNHIYGQQIFLENRIPQTLKDISGIKHHSHRVPLAPRPGEPITITVTTSGPIPFEEIRCWYTSGDTPLTDRDSSFTLYPSSTHWDQPSWDYVRIWKGQLPPQTKGVILRYRIAGDYLIRRNVYADSSAVTFWDKTGDPHPTRLQRNTQDLAYALLAPTIYYYLTRDDEVLDMILKNNQFIWKEYYEKSDLAEHTKLMKWVLEDFEGDSTNIKELLAPLDQLNAYLLLLARVAPDSLSTAFQRQIRELAYSIKDNFYSPEYNIFWGRLNKKSFDGNTDFAHGIKTFWMLYVAADYINDESLAAFAKKGADKLLKTAYLEETGSWASKYKDSSLALDKNIMTWEFDELDQMTATLSFHDTSYYSKYLKQTYMYYEEYMINHTVGGTYLGRSESGLDLGFRTGWWFSNFHDLEHALLGYFSTANYYGDNIKLYFAFDKKKMPDKHKINPYHYQAEIANIKSEPFHDERLEEFARTKVSFNSIKSQ